MTLLAIIAVLVGLCSPVLAGDGRPSGEMPAVTRESVPAIPATVCVGEDGPMGEAYVDPTGRLLTSKLYEYTAAFSEGFAVVLPREGDKFGFIERTTMKEAIPCQYDIAMDFSEGLAAVYMGDGWGFINTKGEVVIKPTYLKAHGFTEGRAGVRLNRSDSKKWAFIDPKGQIVSKGEFAYLGGLSDGLAPFSDGKREGYVDRDGNIVVPAQFKIAGEFNRGLALAGTENGGRGYIDREGKWVIPPVYDQVKPWSGSVGAVGVRPKGGKGLVWRLINVEGQGITKYKFLNVGKFVDGLALAKSLEGKDGFIDKKGRWVIEPRYKFAHPFIEGYAVVQKIYPGESDVRLIFGPEYIINRRGEVTGECTVPPAEAQHLLQHRIRQRPTH